MHSISRSLALSCLFASGLLAAGCSSMGAARTAPPASVNDGALVAPNGMTLYTYDKDTAGKSNCVDSKCLDLWPVLVAPAGATASGDWSIVTRTDGIRQWAYRGKPVYTFSKDEKPGDRDGDRFKNVWNIARP